MQKRDERSRMGSKMVRWAVIAVICASAALMIAGCSSLSGKDNAYVGDWNITEAYGMTSADRIDASWPASGKVKVSKSHMSIDARSQGTSMREEGDFLDFNDRGYPMYETDEGLYLAIGKNSGGQYIAVFMGEELSNGSIGFILERSV